MLRVAYGLTLLLFVLSISLHDSQTNKFVPMLVWFLPILWSMWLLCTIVEANKSAGKLIVLWCLIDVTALAVLNLSIGYANSHIGPKGDELVFVIAFLPVLLPVLLASYDFAIGTILSAFGKGVAFWLIGERINTLLFDWISFSVISAMPSFCFLCFFYFWRKRRQVKA